MHVGRAGDTFLRASAAAEAPGASWGAMATTHLRRVDWGQVGLSLNSAGSIHSRHQGVNLDEPARESQEALAAETHELLLTFASANPLSLLVVHLHPATRGTKAPGKGGKSRERQPPPPSSRGMGIMLREAVHRALHAAKGHPRVARGTFHSRCGPTLALPSGILVRRVTSSGRKGP